jgi:hypothetical protein
MSKKTRGNFSVGKRLPFFTTKLAPVRISESSKNFFRRIVLNRVLSNAEFDADSESHVEISKSTKVKKWAGIYSK